MLPSTGSTQTQASRHGVEDVDVVVDAAEVGLAGAAGEDGDVGEGVHALVVLGFFSLVAA